MNEYRKGMIKAVREHGIVIPADQVVEFLATGTLPAGLSDLSPGLHGVFVHMDEDGTVRALPMPLDQIVPDLPRNEHPWVLEHLDPVGEC